MQASLLLVGEGLPCIAQLMRAVCHWLLATITLLKAGRTESGSSFAVPPRCEFLMLMLLSSPRSVPVQRPAASSSDVLACVDLSVYLMMEGNGDL